MRLSGVLLTALLTFGIGAHGAAQEQRREQPVSKAETLLFMTSHLQPIKKNAALKYHFTKSGPLEDNFKDDVELLVEVNQQGARTVTPTYLTGKNQIAFGPIPEAEGNPVILYFLESDLKEMKRLTGGSTIYFQRRIRNALADAAEVKPVEFRFNGKTVKGTEILVRPYVGDPIAQEKGKEKYAPLLGKYYVFTLSDAVPGGVYQMKAVIPELTAGGPGAKTLLEDVLTFTAFEAGS